jgi:hypothetical protein
VLATLDGTATLWTLAALPTVLANAGTATLWTLAAPPTVLTNPGTATLFALAALPAMLTFLLLPFRRCVRRDIAKGLLLLLLDLWLLSTCSLLDTPLPFLLVACRSSPAGLYILRTAENT